MSCQFGWCLKMGGIFSSGMPEAFQHLLPLTENEHDFLDQLLDQGIIRPELLSDDVIFIGNVKNHPAFSGQHSKVK